MKILLGKSDDIHRINNSCSWMDHSCDCYLYFEWISNFKWSRNKRTCWKLRLGVCPCVECRWICLHTFKGNLNYLNLCQYLTNCDWQTEFKCFQNRLWRKSRTPHSLNRFCIGVDQNRNFDDHHGEKGTSKNPCSETYPGPEPFSEPETQALADFIGKFDNIKLYLSFHAYGQMLLFPYVSVRIWSNDWY